METTAATKQGLEETGTAAKAVAKEIAVAI